MDKTIIKRVNSGDKDAFKLVFDKYYNMLCAFTYKYIPDRDESKDIVQEVFMAFWEQKKDFAHMNGIKAFLFTSARNTCLNNLKHKSVKQKHEERLIYELESYQFFTNHVIEEDAFNLLYEEINHLPIGSQKIMLLALKGLKNREIAEKLDVSENTVKTQKKIAYAKIKKNIGPNLRSILFILQAL